MQKIILTKSNARINRYYKILYLINNEYIVKLVEKLDTTLIFECIKKPLYHDSSKASLDYDYDRTKVTIYELSEEEAFFENL